MYDIIVIGGGPAGVTSALRSKELGARVALVERRTFGGTCTNDGCVPTRVLARAARLMREAEKFEQFGLNGPKPTVDFARLVRYARETVHEIHQKKEIGNHLLSLGIETFTEAGSARFVTENEIETETGLRLQARKFIIAAGGHTRKVTFPGSDLALSVVDIWGLTKLPKSIAIVGAAATGCQLASILNAFGVEVHLLEVSQRILRLEDPLTSRVIMEQFTRRGINIITGIGGVDSIKARDSGKILHYTVGGDPATLEVEEVLLSIGWVGNLDEMNLPAAGIETERGYIKVNDYLQTSNPNIFAVGDINGRMMLVQSGSYQGRIAAENAILGPGVRQDHRIVPHGGFTDPEYASVGLTEEQARAQKIDYVAAVVPFADMDRAIIDREPEGFCKLLVSPETHRILGAHVVGEQAVEIVQIAAAGMATDMWIEQLAELQIAYPTYTAVIGLTARKILMELGVIPLSTEWRTLGKPLVAEWERTTDEMASEIYDAQSELTNMFSSV
ncbi:MAG TPA: NAD(P)/FAD-dependent oxidoreductase [Chloroflexi bacterium]|nr:NAD(P)/FAD-dependent oxidoreductase [Chloroflexota bacterium]